MKTVKVTTYPTIIYTDEKTAQEESAKHQVNVCRIIYVDTFDKTEKFIGYGLYDEKLLQSEDFISV